MQLEYMQLEYMQLEYSFPSDANTADIGIKKVLKALRKAHILLIMLSMFIVALFGAGMNLSLMAEYPIISILSMLAIIFGLTMGFPVIRNNVQRG